MRFIATIIAVALSVTVQASAMVSDDQLQSFLAKEMASANVPGVSYGLVENGETSSGVAGVVDAEATEPVSEETAFIIGSVSKSFTALAVMQMVEAGQVDLDAPIGAYLDVFDGNPQAAAVTIRQLLSHTSGYSTHQGNQSQADYTRREDALEMRVKDIGAMTLAYAPGTAWDYSNANYMLAGRLIEVVSGQSYDDYVNENVLRPAGMTHSFVGSGNLDPRLAKPHEPWLFSRRVIRTEKFGRGSAPQGGIASTGGDLAIYLALMMNGEDDLISADSKALMMQPASEASPNYGLGWFVDQEAGKAWHTGLSPGYEALAVMKPKENRAAVILSNAASGTGTGELYYLHNGFAELAIGVEYNSARSGFWPKMVYLGFMLAPLAFLAAMIWAWTKRAAIRAKSGAMGLVSLWMPLITTSALACVGFYALPHMIGAPISAIRAFQPDFAFGLVATGITGVAWALFRLGIGYTGRSAPSPA